MTHSSTSSKYPDLHWQVLGVPTTRSKFCAKLQLSQESDVDVLLHNVQPG